MIIQILLCMFFCFQLTCSLELILTEKRTCLGLQISRSNSFEEYEKDKNDKTLLSFHCNMNIEPINMIVYDENKKKIKQTGSNFDYQSYLQINLQPHKTYNVCFVKGTTTERQVHYDILDEQDLHIHAGKEDISKLSRKITDFLVDIRRSGWQTQELIQYHKIRKQNINQYNSELYSLFAVKLAVMVIIISAQIIAVKKIYE